MRPDFVTEQNTPTLWKLAREGITFRNHHAVYPSATMVNGTAMVTGILSRQERYHCEPCLSAGHRSSHAVDVELPPTVKKGDELSGGKYVAVPTLPISSNAQALAASLRLQRLSAFCWIDNSASALYLHTTESRQTGSGNCCCASTTV